MFLRDAVVLTQQVGARDEVMLRLPIPQTPRPMLALHRAREACPLESQTTTPVRLASIAQLPPLLNACPAVDSVPAIAMPPWERTPERGSPQDRFRVMRVATIRDLQARRRQK